MTRSCRLMASIMALLSHSHISVLPSTSVQTKVTLVSAAFTDKPMGEYLEIWEGSTESRVYREGEGGYKGLMVESTGG